MAATMGDKAINLEAMKGVLPKPVATEILSKAYGDSLAAKLSGAIAMPITGSSIAWSTGEPVAGVVSEGGVKPVIKSGVATKTVTPIKVAAIAYWSKEARQANPAGFLDMLQAQTADAIRRAIDLAVFHGKDGITGNTIPGVEYIAQTSRSVELGTSGAAAGGLNADILAGYEQVVDAGGDFTAFAADKRMRTRLLKAVDTQGRPIYEMSARGGVSLNDPFSTLMGLPVHYGEAVAGKLGVAEDSKIRLIGGDFANNLKFGYVENLTFRKTDVGTLDVGSGQTVNLFQQNMEAYLVEAQFGWLIRDVNAFVKYTVGA